MTLKPRRAIAGAVAPRLHAFDIETGKRLWKGDLPASGHAMPMTSRLRPTERATQPPPSERLWAVWKDGR